MSCTELKLKRLNERGLIVAHGAISLRLTKVLAIRVLFPMTSPTDSEAIRSVIEGQLQAFQRDDAIAAFSFASPAIQDQFGSPETFMQMVKTGYRPVYRPRSILFDKMTTVEGMPAQKVILLSEADQLVVALYLMQQQPNQSWRIHGCFLMPASEQTAEEPE